MKLSVFKILFFAILVLFITVLSGAAMAQGLGGTEDILKVHGTVFKENLVGTLKPVAMGTNGIVAAQGIAPTLVGYEILRKGGNAFDAGVATMAALRVTTMFNAGWCGVTPMMGYVAKENKVIMRQGVGTAPALATPEWFNEQGYDGFMPSSGKEIIVAAIMPTDVDTQIAILQDYGTISLAEAYEGAIRLAEEGWPINNAFVNGIVGKEEGIKVWPYNAEVWLQYGRPPKPGELLYQKDLAKTLKLLVEAEQKALKSGFSRRAALEAARDVFYKGEIAQAIDKFFRENGGLFRYDDLANWRGHWSEPFHTTYRGVDIYTMNTSTQAPIMIEMFNMLEAWEEANGIGIEELGHNSAEYIHLLSQIINLAISDRYHWYGDTDFVTVPDGLFTKEYAKELIKKIDMDKAQQEMPPKSDPSPFSTNLSSLDSYSNAVAALPELTEGSDEDEDTTQISVMDKWGNIFTMTPSDGQLTTPLIPGYGFGLSNRGRRFMRVNGHPADIAPGKMPLNSTNPAIAVKDGKPYMGWGTSGGDDQNQTMFQLFLNVHVFGMNPQQAIEQNRFGSKNFIATASPYKHQKGVIRIHDGIEKEVIEALEAKGHKVVLMDWTAYMASPVMIVRDDNGVMWGGADFRRDQSIAVGW